MDVLERLTPQERKVVMSIYNLVPRKQTISDLNIARSTFNAYLHTSCLKLGVRSTEELVLKIERAQVSRG